jgi:hypothetical protein
MKPAIISVRNFKKGKGKVKEDKLQEQISSYMRRKYSSVVFTSEQSGLYSSGYELARKLKATRSGHVHLDMFFSEARGGYFGMYLELKKEGEHIYRLDGGFVKQTEKKIVMGAKIEFDHLEEQRNSIDLLRSKGYLCFFAIGLDNAMRIIDDYMAMPPTEIKVDGGGMNQSKYTYEKDREVLQRKPKGQKEKG